MARYLVERPHTTNTPTNSNFAALVNYVVDQLVEGSNEDISEQLRYQYMKVLCLEVTDTLPGAVLQNIFPKTAQPVSKFEDRYHVITAAVLVGESSIVKRVLEDKYLNIAEVRSEFWGTPLHAAVVIRNRELVRELLDRGVDVNMRAPGTRFVPLEAAYFNRDEETVRLLLEPRYKLTKRGRVFNNAIVSSLSCNQPSIARLLLADLETKLSESRYILSDGLRAACRHGMTDIVQILLDNGGDVNEQRNTGDGCPSPSLIQQAVWTGQEEVLRLLLARGANPYGRELGSDSMCAAAWGGRIGATKILLDAGLRLEPRQWLRGLEVAAPLKGSKRMGPNAPRSWHH